MDLAEFQRRRALIDRLNRDADRKAGAADQLREEIKTEFGDQALADGAVAIKEQERLAAKAERRAEALWQDLVERFPQLGDGQ